MTSPPEEITVTCPDCKRVYKDWYRPSINLGHWRQLTCYLLGFVVYFGCMQRNVELEATIVAKYAVVSPVLDERSRRRWAATESLFIGYGSTQE